MVGPEAITDLLTRAGVPDVVLCGHSRCGAMAALASEPLHHAADTTALGRWLRHAAPAREAIDAAKRFSTPSERLEAIVLENVRLQLRHLMQFRCVAEAVHCQRLRLHGLLYRLENGCLDVVETVQAH